MIEKVNEQIRKNGLLDFEELLKEVSQLSKEKQEKILIYVQGFLARDAMDKNKVS